MLTINDLNLSIDFWKWLCGLTEDYFYSEEGIREKEFNRLVCINIKEIYCESKRAAESIIYQAKDGLNDLFVLHENENNFYEIIESSRVLIIQKSMIYSCPIPVHHIVYNEYKDKTTARLAAFKWVWEQERENVL